MNTYYYDGARAAAYAQKWAFGRNPDYYNFDNIGGDCTNFASQCIFAGCGVMNYSPLFGWFYRSVNNRTPSWTGVEFLYKFIVNNDGVGPFAKTVELNDIRVGDIVQLGDANGSFYHSPVVTGIARGKILVAAHSFDTFGKDLASYNAPQLRPIHILGYRK